MQDLSQAEKRERLARWLELPSADVATSLAEYGKTLESELYSMRADTDLEEGLLRRNNRLITLALARYASSPKVVATIYKFASRTSEDTQEE